MSFLKRDIFGNIVFLKGWLIFLLGSLTYPRLNWLNTTKVEGTENLEKLPDKNVLFVSNHQTYFGDVFLMYHVFASVKWGFKNKISNPIYLLKPKTNIYFVAAEETMKAGIIPKVLAYAGSVSIKRTFREAGKDINRQVDMKDITNIGEAIKDGWVVTFPQGTTTPYAKGRRGTVHIIKKYQPIVVPVIVDGFRRAFDKKGLKIKKRGVTLKIKFKEPMQIDYDIDADKILEQIMIAIGQVEEPQSAHS